LRRKNAGPGCNASSLQRGKLGIVEIALSSEYASVRDSRRGDAKSAWREMRLCLVATTSVSLRVTRRERQQPGVCNALRIAVDKTRSADVRRTGYVRPLQRNVV
jgi:hypothetical protein